MSSCKSNSQIWRWTEWIPGGSAPEGSPCTAADDAGKKENMQNRAREQKALGLQQKNQLAVGLWKGNGGAAPTICAHDNCAFCQRAERYHKQKAQAADELFVLPAKAEESSKGKPRKKWNS